MIFRQLYHHDSGTYTYLLGGRAGGEALIIDPVQERVERYLALLEELDLTLSKVLDTHVHADHISGMAELRDRTSCVTVMGREAPVDVVSMRVGDGDPIEIEGVRLLALHTPGHTAESYSFAMGDRVVIMGRGVIEQVGAPQTVYRHPANRFVAEFVGTNNLLSGTAAEVSEDRIVIETPLGTFAAPVNPERPVADGDAMVGSFGGCSGR